MIKYRNRYGSDTFFTGPLYGYFRILLLADGSVITDVGSVKITSATGVTIEDKGSTSTTFDLAATGNVSVIQQAKDLEVISIETQEKVESAAGGGAHC